MTVSSVWAVELAAVPVRIAGHGGVVLRGLSVVRYLECLSSVGVGGLVLGVCVPWVIQ